MWYCYEMHAHSAQCSACAVSTSLEQVRAFHQAGYAGLVLTDHFIYGNTCVPRELPWEERMRRYYASYEEAKAEGERLDFDVLFGLELAYGDGKEVLLYGIGLDFLLDNPDIPRLPLEGIVERVHAYGGLVVQAHPFRDRPYINMAVQPKPWLLDGAEVYNCGNHPEDEPPAIAMVKEHGLIPTSGSDIHNVKREPVGRAGLAFPHRVRTNRELVQALQAREGKLIIEGEIREDYMDANA